MSNGTADMSSTNSTPSPDGGEFNMGSCEESPEVANIHAGLQ